MARSFLALFSDWGVPAQTPETLRLVEALRAQERDSHAASDARSPEEADALLWRAIARDVPEALSWEATAPLCDLCERALALRGPFEGGHARLAMREKARILLHLRTPRRGLPRSPQDLLALWDEATRLEPVIRLRVDAPRWRTEADGLPFTGMGVAWLNGPRPLAPGQETADPADIPALVVELVRFLDGSPLTPEVKAASVPHLIGYIHPLADGNVHTGRLLMCDLLSRAGVGESTLLAYVDAHQAHKAEWSKLIGAVYLGEVDADALVCRQLSMLLRSS